jgi:Flp pilus assembly secretin CpaC
MNIKDVVKKGNKWYCDFCDQVFYSELTDPDECSNCENEDIEFLGYKLKKKYRKIVVADLMRIDYMSESNAKDALKDAYVLGKEDGNKLIIIFGNDDKMIYTTKLGEFKLKTVKYA